MVNSRNPTHYTKIIQDYLGAIYYRLEMFHQSGCPEPVKAKRNNGKMKGHPGYFTDYNWFSPIEPLMPVS